MKKITGFHLILVFFLMFELSFAQTRSSWTVFVPDFAIANFAGFKGKYAFGAGYNLNRRHSLQLGILYGFTPKSDLPDLASTYTARGIYFPKVYQFGSGFAFSPQVAVDLSYTIAMNKNTWISLPQHFPHNYYSSTAIRVHLGIGGNISYHTGEKYIFKKIDFYAETTTNDLYAKYFLRYRNLSVPDIFTLGIGMNLWF